MRFSAGAVGLLRMRLACRGGASIAACRSARAVTIASPAAVVRP